MDRPPPLGLVTAKHTKNIAVAASAHAIEHHWAASDTLFAPSRGPHVFMTLIRLAHTWASMPSEKSSGDRCRLGAITKLGNSHARAPLMQASWGLMRLRRTSDPLQQWALFNGSTYAIRSIAKHRSLASSSRLHQRSSH